MIYSDSDRVTNLVIDLDTPISFYLKWNGFTDWGTPVTLGARSSAYKSTGIESSQKGKIVISHVSGQSSHKYRLFNVHGWPPAPENIGQADLSWSVGLGVTFSQGGPSNFVVFITGLSTRLHDNATTSPSGFTDLKHTSRDLSTSQNMFPELPQNPSKIWSLTIGSVASLIARRQPDIERIIGRQCWRPIVTAQLEGAANRRMTRRLELEPERPALVIGPVIVKSLPPSNATFASGHSLRNTAPRHMSKGSTATKQHCPSPNPPTPALRVASSATRLYWVKGSKARDVFKKGALQLRRGVISRMMGERAFCYITVWPGVEMVDERGQPTPVHELARRIVVHAARGNVEDENGHVDYAFSFLARRIVTHASRGGAEEVNIELDYTFSFVVDRAGKRFEKRRTSVGKVEVGEILLFAIARLALLAVSIDGAGGGVEDVVVGWQRREEVCNGRSRPWIQFTYYLNLEPNTPTLDPERTPSKAMEDATPLSAEYLCQRGECQRISLFFLLPSQSFRTFALRPSPRSIQLFMRMPCTPPFHPGPGHDDRTCHDKVSGCYYYAVADGRVRGVFTNSWIAREQVEGYVNFSMKSFKTWAEMEFWWGLKCQELHTHGCPPFETVTFTLTPHPVLQPGPSPCTRRFPRIAAVPTIPHYFPPAAPAAPVAGPSSVAAPALVVPAAAPSPFNSPGPSTSTSRVIPISSSADELSSSASSASSLSASSTSGVKKEEAASPIVGSPSIGRVLDPSTRIHLTPAGRAHGEFLVARNSQLATPTRATNAPGEPASPSSTSAPASPSPPASRAPTSAADFPSVLITPNNAAAPAPAPEPTPGPAPRIYGVRGVGVFYDTFGSARRAARRLRLADSKIMVSTDPAKIEAWITGQPFNGEDA
ncbi:hypothetical protein C8F04DRAFT_1197911 [Mycena alexandri]|uniref:Ribonuclease H1 N-terminal domain-containing protein n=1 Tax=Mycena alexandri TaxID=1745969 RepID=A0AAD6S297_9AGAR|nr:hypothetical protein C8F04DRAFT_1197911 [Mycena alexandri]